MLITISLMLMKPNSLQAQAFQWASLESNNDAVTKMITDASGNSSTGTVLLTIADTTAPLIQSCTVSPNVLSSPNHQLVPVTVSVSAVDSCDSTVSRKITSITADETVSPGDIQITGDLTATLAASRNASGPGRVYTITIQCKDSSGNASTTTVTVSVPKGSGNGNGNGNGHN